MNTGCLLCYYCEHVSHCISLQCSKPAILSPVGFTVVALAPICLNKFEARSPHHRREIREGHCYCQSRILFLFTHCFISNSGSLSLSKVEQTLKKKIITVAARLRSLRSDDPLSKGHPRSIKQGLEL